MDDRQLDLILKESFEADVDAHAHVLDGMEARVLEKIQPQSLDLILKDTFELDVEARAHVLEGMEERVLAQLAPQPEPEKTRRRWTLFPRLPQLRLNMAMAAAFAVVIFLVGNMVGDFWGSPFGGQKDYQGVTFVVAIPNANSVEVVGDFTGWQKQSMTRDENGVWTLAFDLDPGRYEYAFVIDGQEWKPDPLADEYVKSYNSTNSVRYVSSEGETS